MPSILETASRDLAAMPRGEQQEAIRGAFQALPDDQRRAFAESMAASIPPPGPTTTNRIWLIIIIAFVAVLGMAVLTLCVTVFLPPQQGATKPDTILTIFTTTTAFLAGLFAPSPVGSK